MGAEFIALLKTIVAWTPKVLAAFAVALAFLLYAPPEWIAAIQADRFMASSGEHIGPTFLLAVCLLGVDVAWRIAPAVRRWCRARSAQFLIIVRWWSLNDRQRTVLARTIANHTDKLVAYRGREEIQTLVDRHFLMPAGWCKYGCEDLWWYRISDVEYAALLKYRGPIRRYLLKAVKIDAARDTWDMLNEAREESRL